MAGGTAAGRQRRVSMEERKRRAEQAADECIRLVEQWDKKRQEAFKTGREGELLSGLHAKIMDGVATIREGLPATRLNVR